MPHIESNNQLSGRVMIGDEALGRARTPYLLNQFGELPVVHCIQTNQHIGIAVVVWRGEKTSG